MGIDPLTAGAFAGVNAIGSLAGGALNASAVRDTNAANIEFQKQANAQNEMLMREAWSRDDSAVLRRANDLERAGLSKTLAAGSAAAASSPIKLEPAKMQANTGMGDAVQNLAGNLGQMPGKLMQLKLGNAQADLMNNQYLTESAKQDNLKSAEVKNYADAGQKKMAEKVMKQGYDTQQNTGVTPGDTSSMAKVLRMAEILGIDIKTAKQLGGEKLEQMLNDRKKGTSVDRGAGTLINSSTGEW